MSKGGLIMGPQVFDFLRSAADGQELSRSSYWDAQMDNFAIDAEGRLQGSNAAGSVSRKTGALYRLTHWILQTPWRRMGRRYPRFLEMLALGRLVAARQERQFTEDMMRQVLTIAMVADHADLGARDEVSCVIGDGYGVLTALLLLAFPGRKVVFVNLRKPLLADAVFLSKAVPGVQLASVVSADAMAVAVHNHETDAIALCADDADALSAAPIGMAFNIASMQEMTPAVTSDYFRRLRDVRATRTMFYCCNRVHKVLPDGTVTKFLAYLWRAEDEILIDGPCPWMEWYYSMRPPFWHRRPQSHTARHRLVRLAKNAGR